MFPELSGICSENFSIVLLMEENSKLNLLVSDTHIKSNILELNISSLRHSSTTVQYMTRPYRPHFLIDIGPHILGWIFNE